MAVGTVTRVAVDPHQILAPIAMGDLKMTVTTVVGPASYTTGGDALTAAQLGLSFVTHAIARITAATGTNSAAINSIYNVANQTLQFLVTSGVSPVVAQEAANAANLSGITVTVTAWGY